MLSYAAGGCPSSSLETGCDALSGSASAPEPAHPRCSDQAKAAATCPARLLRLHSCTVGGTLWSPAETETAAGHVHFFSSAAATAIRLTDGHFSVCVCCYWPRPPLLNCRLGSDGPTVGPALATLKVKSYNVRGLCSPGKRSKLWWELKRLGAQVVFL